MDRPTQTIIQQFNRVAAVTSTTEDTAHPGEGIAKLGEGPEQKLGEESSVISIDKRQRRKKLHPQRYDPNVTDGGISVATNTRQSDCLDAAGDAFQQRGEPWDTSDDDPPGDSCGNVWDQQQRRQLRTDRRLEERVRVKMESAAEERQGGSLSRHELLLQARQDPRRLTPSGECLVSQQRFRRTSMLTDLAQVKMELSDDHCLHGGRQRELQLNGEHPDFIIASQTLPQTAHQREEHEIGYDHFSGHPVSFAGTPTAGMVSLSSDRPSLPVQGHAYFDGVSPPTSACSPVRLRYNPITAMMNAHEYNPYLLGQWQQNMSQNPQLCVPEVFQSSQNHGVEEVQSVTSSADQPLKSTVKLQSGQERPNGKNTPNPMTTTSAVGYSQLRVPGVNRLMIVQPSQDVQFGNHSTELTTTNTILHCTNQPPTTVSADRALGSEIRHSDVQKPLVVSIPEVHDTGTAMPDVQEFAKGTEDEKHANRLEVKRQKYHMQATDPAYMDHVRAKKRERYHARRQDPDYVLKERQKKRERYHRSRQNLQTVEKTREKKRELYYRARQNPDWVNKTKEKKREIYYRARQNPNWVAKTREKKREIYYRARQNPDWVSKTREKKRELYHRARQDPHYIEKQRDKKNNGHNTAIMNVPYIQWTSEPVDTTNHNYLTYIETSIIQNPWAPEQQADQVMIDDKSNVINALLSLQQARHSSEAVPCESIYPGTQTDPWYVMKARERLKMNRLCQSTNVNRMDPKKPSQLEIWRTQQIKRKHTDIVHRSKRWARRHKQKRLIRFLSHMNAQTLS